MRGCEEGHCEGDVQFGEAAGCRRVASDLLLEFCLCSNSVGTLVHNLRFRVKKFHSYRLVYCLRSENHLREKKVVFVWEIYFHSPM